MADHTNKKPQRLTPKGRPAGRTEQSWIRAVTGGTGITVAALQLTKPPRISLLQNALHKLQNSHPILRSKLHHNTTTNTFSFITTPHLQINSFPPSSTSHILQSHQCANSLSPLHIILEHELNNNVWSDLSCGGGVDVLFASVYAVTDGEWVVVLRLHMAVCDRTTVVGLLQELKRLISEGRVGGGWHGEMGNGEGEMSLAIEDLIPMGKDKKTLWGHGVDMLGYSVNSLRSTNLKFRDVKGPRRSQAVRLQMGPQDTKKILYGCKSRGIKLCGVLAAAGLIAAHYSRHGTTTGNHQKKYAVVTLIDCRSSLDPPLSSLHFGFYHSAIVNIHIVKGGENLWDLASRNYKAFANSKGNNKHFTDMADLNFLMCKAIENPSLTPSSSLRASLISVFEDSVIYNSNEMELEVGLEDCMGCASVHSMGPSIAICDSIQNGRLDCVCVYPSPLHSREQMEELVNHMKRILVDGSNCLDGEE